MNSGDADLAALDDAPEDEPTAGELMFAAVREWAKDNNPDHPTLVSRCVLIVECQDSVGAWIDRAGFTMDGCQMMPWDVLGFMEYAALRETHAIREELSADGEDGDDD